ncbi:MAG: Spy/CpxP family protein refolding chaperone [Melioribacter sp.]|uniref:Spy/CpxP family protein refolding chaperone n=1 Tax=Rosettibacter primus TaxID=3111523 RepID=UPI00247C6A47|nr:Spy/CpxP family protein refolding chaperone [Melioribacter sp.]
MKKITYFSIIILFLFGISTYAQPDLFADLDNHFDDEAIEIEKDFIDNPIQNDQFVEEQLPGIQIHKRMMRDRLFDKLNLSDEQKKQFNNLMSEHQKKMVDLRAQLQKNRIDIKNMMLQNKIDEKKLLDLVQANNKILSEMRIASINHWLSVYKILNDEQKELWAKLWGNSYGYGKHVIIKNKIFDRLKMKGCR